MLTKSDPHSRNILLSALVENLGPSIVTMVPPWWYSNPNSSQVSPRSPRRRWLKMLSMGKCKTPFVYQRHKNDIRNTFKLTNFYFTGIIDLIDMRYMYQGFETWFGIDQGRNCSENLAFSNEMKNWKVRIV